jgi:hypothetical protein
MTPKEKAQELVLSMLWQIESDNHPTIISEKAIRCALITVDEIINSYPHTFDKDVEYLRSGEEVTSIVNIRPNVGWWQEVKQEIESL